MRGVLGDNCAVRLFRHDKPEKIFTSLEVSICDELRSIESLLRRCAGIVTNDGHVCFRPLHRQTRKGCERCADCKKRLGLFSHLIPLSNPSNYVLYN